MRRPLSSFGAVLRKLGGAGFGVLCLAVPALAQTVYPAGSLQGQAEFGAFPQVSINCTRYTLGPGVRVLDAQHRIVPVQQLSGVSSRVVFQVDAMGNVFRVWLIRPQEAAQLQVPQAPGQCGLFFSGEPASGAADQGP
ncbi:MAG: hypothetical protein AB7S55_00875 [Thiomonas sp.]|uniref:hypothetical protein n=1 Tax=Thiomonas sp. TaxID=2047785 RepID=UPI0026105979|nr:hypothetical protein [Thiomonas sp.]